MNTAVPYECDLHTHSIRSDGGDSYAELIDRASLRGLKVIAITDHDVAPLLHVEDGGRRVPLAEYARHRRIAVIPGAEYSCETDVDDVHILGLGCDWSHPGLTAEAERMAASKTEAYRTLVGLLSSRGLSISWEYILENSGRPLAGGEVQRKHIFEALARKGYAPTWREAKLMVLADPSLNVRREKTDPRAAIGLIRGAGGIAVLAHPYLIEPEPFVGGKRATRNGYIASLVEAGLEGIEAAYPYDKTSYSGGLEPGRIESEVREAWGGKISFFTGGSDYHGEWRKGMKNPREIGEKGMPLDALRAAPRLAALADACA